MYNLSLTEAEKEKSIQLILACGMPKLLRLSHSIALLFHNLRLRDIFFGVEDCLFLSTLLGGLGCALLYFGAFHQLLPLQPLLFFISPFLYGLLCLLTAWKEEMSGLYEWKMTCFYTLRQISVLRMLLFGAAAVTVNVLANTALWLCFSHRLSLLRMTSLSFASLFLFACLQLLFEMKTSTASVRRYTLCRSLPPIPWRFVFVPALWCILGATLLLSGQRAEHLLQSLPTAAVVLAAAAALFSYLRLLSRCCFSRQEIPGAVPL